MTLIFELQQHQLQPKIKFSFMFHLPVWKILMTPISHSNDDASSSSSAITNGYINGQNNC